jgi:hypothetical protein
MTYSVLLYAHVLLFVFWIGTDVGVFLLGRIAQRDAYPVQRRVDAFSTALVLDRFPRICFALMAPVGFQLAAMAGYVTLPYGLLWIIWAVASLWLGTVFASFLLDVGPLFRAARTTDRVIQAIVMVTLIGMALSSFASGQPTPMMWLAGKMLAFGLLAAAALVLDFLSTPMLFRFQELDRDGLSPALQARIYHGMNRIYVCVGIVYACALIAGFLGTTKLPA